MARMCCDTRKSVRQTAINYLQRALLAHELQNLTSSEWEACFLQVILTSSEAYVTPCTVSLHCTGVVCATEVKVGLHEGSRAIFYHKCTYVQVVLCHCLGFLPDAISTFGS